MCNLCYVPTHYNLLYRYLLENYNSKKNLIEYSYPKRDVHIWSFLLNLNKTKQKLDIKKMSHLKKVVSRFYYYIY